MTTSGLQFLTSYFVTFLCFSHYGVNSFVQTVGTVKNNPLIGWNSSYRAVLFKLEFIIQMRAAAKHKLPLLPLLPTLLLPSFSSFPFVSEQNGGPKKASNTQIRGTGGM